MCIRDRAWNLRRVLHRVPLPDAADHGAVMGRCNISANLPQRTSRGEPRNCRPGANNTRAYTALMRNLRGRLPVWET
eukprot:3614392-Alexandrium_andersonii.AAC.1